MNTSRFVRLLPVLAVSVALLGIRAAAEDRVFAKDTGYRGIWYCNQKVDTEYVYKYSGGLGTYCADHNPHAIYCAAADKTFFVYGGTNPEVRELWAMISYYDHKTGLVPRPTIVHNKQTDDAHDNPVLSVDDAGHLWVFVSSHGTSRPSFLYKSKRPFDIDDFDLVLETNFSYPQPWHIPGKGFLFLHTHYDGGRVLYTQTSPDGVTWSDRSRLAFMDQGHYQVSFPFQGKVGTAFNFHPNAFAGDPKRNGLNWRTNLYYVETNDMGATWRDARGKVIQTPMTSPDTPALVHDYQSENRLCYIHDINYDANGNPVILHTTASSWEPGPPGEPREWRTAYWTGQSWTLHTMTHSDNNYDTGCIHVEPDGSWRVIGPTETGPQAFNPGGEVALWTSADRGESWTMARTMTHDSEFNHTYVRRPVNAHPGFYGFWADGHGRQPSESRLYFCNRDGDVFRLPFAMTSDAERPIPVE